MTRAMDTLVMTRAATAAAMAATCLRPAFLHAFSKKFRSDWSKISEVPASDLVLTPAMATRTATVLAAARAATRTASGTTAMRTRTRAAAAAPIGLRRPAPGPSGSSMDNIANFIAARGQSVPSFKAGQKFSRPKLDVAAPTGKTGLQQGVRVRHPKYGEGMVFRREGDGDDAKITVQFQQHGVKKLVEKFAQLERL